MNIYQEWKVVLKFTWVSNISYNLPQNLEANWALSEMIERGTAFSLNIFLT